MHRIADGHPQRAGEQADQRKLESVGERDRALALAQYAQHRAIVEMAGGKAARRQRDGHRAQKRRQQRHQVEEFFGPIQRLAHLGPAAFERLHLHAANRRLFDFLRRPLDEGGDIAVRTGHGEAIGQAAGRLDELCGGQIGLVDHHARREGRETGAAVGFDHDDAGDAQLRIAQQQHVAGFQAQRFQHRRIDPGFATRRNVARVGRRRIRLRCHLEVAAQRIARRHGLERYQLGRAALRIAGPPHGRKTQRADALQAERAHLVDERLRRRVVARHHSVAAQQLTRVSGQAALEPVGEKTHGRERRHRQRDGHDQQPQLARAQVAPERAPAQLPGQSFHRGHLN